MNTALNGLEKTPQKTPIRKIEMKNFTFPLILFVIGICAGQTAQASAGDRTSIVGHFKDTTTTISSPRNLNEIRFGG